MKGKQWHSVLLLLLLLLLLLPGMAVPDLYPSDEIRTFRDTCLAPVQSTH